MTHNASSAIAAKVAEAILCLRLRDRAFPPGLFRDPCWQIMLRVYEAELAGRRLSVSGLCHASGVPPTTGLRHVIRLERLGWLGRTADPCDRRRFWSHLTDQARASMDRHFSRLAELHRPDPPNGAVIGDVAHEMLTALLPFLTKLSDLRHGG